MDDNFNDLIDQAIREKAVQHIREAMAKYGVEGAEDVIKGVYSRNHKTRDYLLEIYHKLVKGEIK